MVQPNEDGSYWRKIVRNKMIRMKEKRRLQAGKAFAAEELGLDEETLSGRVVSSYGPYTSIVGTAKKTGVAGLTAEPEMGGDRGEVLSDEALSQLARCAFKDIRRGAHVHDLV